MKTPHRAVFNGYATPTPAEFERIITGALPVVTPNGNVMPHRLSPAGRVKLVEAQARGYVTVGRDRASVALENAFYLWCDMRRIPFARLRRYRLRGNITLDFIRLPQARLFPASVIEDAASFIEAFVLRPEWPHTARITGGMNTIDWRIGAVPLAFADEIISGLVAIATRALQASEGGAQ